MTSLCLHGSDRELFAAQDYITGDRFSIRECRVCGLVRTSPVPDGADIDRYYPQGYYGVQERYGGMAAAFLAAVHARRARRLTAVAGGAGRVLDVGCGPGLFLHALRRQGWQTVGLERTDAAAAHARTRLGLDVRVGEWRDVDLPASGFDAVVLWHVLEHVADPFECLDWATDRLATGGVMLIGVPNFGSYEARWSRDKWFHLDVPRHLTHFTERTLVRLLDGAGLEVRAASGFAPEYDLFSFVQSALNVMGLRPNALYNAMRQRDARMLGADAPAWQVVASAALAAPLGAIGAVATTAAGLLRGGGTMAIFCSRRAGGPATVG